MRLHTFALASLLAVVGCGSDDEKAGSSGTPDGGLGDGGGDPTAGTVPANFTVRPGVEIATVLGAEAKVPLTLYDANGRRMLTMVTDEFGQAHFAYIPDEHLVIESGNGTPIPDVSGTTLQKGDGYVIRNDSVDPPEASEPFSVMGVRDVPDPSLYDQVLPTYTWGIDHLRGVPAGADPSAGFGYIEVRDGVKLSIMVRLPDPQVYGDGPYPTVIEYAGYSPSRPTDPEPGSMIAGLMGYATVGVNMRGTGCSGGVFDLFNPAQHADAYDVIEVIARQPWVKGGKVGMVGLSYSGIAQLYAAYLNPPSLAAVAPQSVLGHLWQQAWPGGIFNEGFTREWLAQRDQQASAGGQSWTDTLITGGDTACEENQQLRSQNINFEAFLKQLNFRLDALDARDLPLLIDQIDVPVFMTGAWQDEQTGPQFASYIDRFTSSPSTHFTLFNGRHPDGYTPIPLSRWFEFLEIYVNERVPQMSQLVQQAAPAEFSNQFGIDGLDFEPDRFASFAANDDYAGAKAFFESDPTVRVLFEAGGDPNLEPGAPVARFEATFDAWPPPSAQGRSYYLASGGLLSETAPTDETVNVYKHDPDAGMADFLGPAGYSLLGPVWDIDWTQFAEGDVLSYLTEPFTQDEVLLGPGYADLYFASEVDDANVQVSISEVRSDDVEVWVTSGWLRVGHRAIEEARSDEFRIERTFREADFQPLTPGEFVEVRIPIPSAGQAFRAGSRMRVTISTPGRNHARWLFDNPTYDGATPTHSIALGGARASRLYLPFVGGIPVAAGYPTCPGLRGQACRPYEPRTNATP